MLFLFSNYCPKEAAAAAIPTYIIARKATNAITARKKALPPFLSAGAAGAAWTFFSLVPHKEQNLAPSSGIFPQLSQYFIRETSVSRTDP